MERQGERQWGEAAERRGAEKVRKQDKQEGKTKKTNVTRQLKKATRKRKKRRKKTDAGDKDSLIYCYLPTSELEKELVMPVESVQYLIASIAAVNQMQ